MNDLILAILLAVSLGVFFKVFPKFNIHLYTAIVVNYWTCVITGNLMYDDSMFGMNVHSEFVNSHNLMALAIGTLFIYSFNIIGKSIHVHGISISSVLQKVSLIITVLFAILYFKESVTTNKVIGIILAISALFFIAAKDKKSNKGLENIGLAALVFFLVGIGDIMLTYAQKEILGASMSPGFVSTIFFYAALWGTIYLGIQIIRGKLKLDGKSILAGILLGIPNYFSLYFLLRAIGGEMDTSELYPILNVSYMVLSAIIGYFFFREKLNFMNIIGFGLSISAIILLTYGKVSG